MFTKKKGQFPNPFTLTLTEYHTVELAGQTEDGQ